MHGIRFGVRRCAVAALSAAALAGSGVYAVSAWRDPVAYAAPKYTAGKYDDTVIVGDSIVSAAMAEIRSGMAGITLDAADGRTLYGRGPSESDSVGAGIVGRLADLAGGYSRYVINAGAYDEMGMTVGDGETIVAALGSGCDIYFVTQRNPSNEIGEQGTKSAIESLCSKYSFVHKIDWASVASSSSDFTGSNGIPTERGAEEYAKLVKGILDSIGTQEDHAEEKKEEQKTEEKKDEQKVEEKKDEQTATTDKNNEKKNTTDQVKREDTVEQPKSDDQLRRIAAGISETTWSALEEPQKDVVSLAISSTTAGIGHPVQWLMKVFSDAGKGIREYPTAMNLYYEFCKSSKRSDIQPGMIVAVPFTQGSGMGGHVGIYIGDGKVVSDDTFYGGTALETRSEIRIRMLDDWISAFGKSAVKWGWAGDQNLSEKPPAQETPETAPQEGGGQQADGQNQNQESFR
jgi:hypothetical protein